MTQPGEAPRTFLVFTDDGKTIASRLKVHLAPVQRMGLTKLHPLEAELGKDVALALQQAIDDAAVVIAILTPELMSRDDLLTACEQANNAGKRVVPLRGAAAGTEGTPFHGKAIVPIEKRALLSLSSADLDAELNSIVSQHLLPVYKALKQQPAPAQAPAPAEAPAPAAGGRAAATPNPTAVPAPKSNSDSTEPEKTKDTGKIKVLFLAANPSEETQLAIQKELREIQERLRPTPHWSKFELFFAPAAQTRDLQRSFKDRSPTIVHFSGHGRELGELLFEDASGEAVAVSPEAIGELFRLRGKSVRCVVLNACYSVAQAEAVRRHVDAVIGMSGEIGDLESIAFAAAFYQSLGDGEDLQTAFDAAKLEIQLLGTSSGDERLPKLLCRDGIQAEQIRLLG